MLLLHCGPKQDQVEKTVEDGVEVIINHLEPYEVKGEPNNLILEEEFRIDTEKDEIAETGLTDISNRGFGVDSEGSIYFINYRKVEYCIFKFDRNGNFVKHFARKGQGPGEIQRPNMPIINNRDEITITDTALQKFLIFSKGGSLLQETKLDSDIQLVIPLKNGKYLMVKSSSGIEEKFSLILCNAEFGEIKELDSTEIPSPYKGNGIKGIYPAFISTISGESIYVGNDKREYEIWEFDLEGILKRKIKKEYKHVEVSEEYKKRYLKQFDSPQMESFKDKVYFPKDMPPFQYMFSDDSKRLYVMTYEKAGNQKECIYDIFNADGVFIARTSFGNISTLAFVEQALPIKSKNDKVYCTREKDNGFKELVVYKMKWE